MTKRAIMFIADGSEEMEVVILTDILRRANIQVTIVGIQLENLNYALLSRNVKLIPDQTDIDAIDFDHFDAVIIPGGAKGTETLKSNDLVLNVVKRFFDLGKWVASVCAGTLVLKAGEVGRGLNVTSHPSVKAKLINEYSYSEERVVIDKNLITSRAPGTCFEFALTLIESLLGKDEMEKVSSGLLLK